MSVLNEAVCRLGSVNTGTGSCPYISSADTHLVFTPDAAVITASDFTDFAATLKAKLVADDRTARWYATPRFNAITPNVTAANVFTAEDGAQYQLRDATHLLSYMVNNASLCDQKNLLQFDQSEKRFRVLRFQKKGYVIGKENINSTTGAIEMRGFKPQKIYVHPMTDGTQAATPNSQIDLNFIDPKKDQKFTVFADLTNFDYEEILDQYRVQNVVLIKGAAGSAGSGVLKFYAKAGCGDTNLGKAFPTALAATTNFVVKLKSTGATQTIGSVAINTSTGEISLTISTPPASGSVVTIDLASVSTLFTAIGMYVEVPTDGVLELPMP